MISHRLTATPSASTGSNPNSGSEGSSTMVTILLAICCPIIPPITEPPSFTMSPSLACPMASWAKTPASSGSRIAGMVPPFAGRASRSEMARSAAVRPSASWWRRFRPMMVCSLSLPIWRVPPSSATATTENPHRGRRKWYSMPSELEKTTVETSSTYRARVFEIPGIRAAFSREARRWVFSSSETSSGFSRGVGTGRIRCSASASSTRSSVVRESWSARSMHERTSGPFFAEKLSTMMTPHPVFPSALITALSTKPVVAVSTTPLSISIWVDSPATWRISK